MASAKVDYAREVAPILRAYCAGCHNDADLEGDLSVETHAQLVAGGNKRTIKAGAAEDSYLIKVIEGRAKPKMPPRDEPQPSADDVALLRQWIAEGAEAPAEDVSILSTLEVPQIEAKAERRPITAAARSKDGRRYAVARFGTVELREGGRVHLLEGMPGKVTTLAFSADGSRLVAGGGVTGLRGVAMVWDLERRDAAPLVLEAGDDLVYAARFSPSGERIATGGYDRLIRLWKSDGTPERTIDVHKGAVFDLAFHPGGGALASASADETVKLWRVSDGMRLDTLTGPAGEQFAVAFSVDGKHLLAAGADNRVRMWRMLEFDAPRIQPLVHARFAHESSIEDIEVVAGGKYLVTAASDRSMKLWSLPSLEQLGVFEAQPDSVSGLDARPGEDWFDVTRLDGSEISYRATPAKSDTGPVDQAAGQGVDLAAAVELPVPSEQKGAIGARGETDLFRFNAKAADEIVFEIDAARSGSGLDSKIEVLHPDGRPVEQVVLQAVRDSWFTFRGKDSSTSDDFRLHNWREMELNQFVYSGGEVTKLWHYPRGPDSGFRIYPGYGKRWTYFGTTAVSHALGAPLYVVEPLPAGSQPPPNGLPVIRLNYENDDDPLRAWGADSRLLFEAPSDGEFVLRVSDVRGFGAAEGYGYTLIARPSNPDFSVSIGGKAPKISPGSGEELTFNLNRTDGFDGAVRIDIDGVPEGYSVTTPVEIGAGQGRAFGTLFASADAPPMTEEQWKAIEVTARAKVRDNVVEKALGDLGKVELAGEAKLLLMVRSLGDDTGVVELRPGETAFALAGVDRRDFGGRVEFGKDDSGRSMPHGLYVDNIGLNGLMIVEGQHEREFAITAAPWVEPCEGWLYLRTGADGGKTSAPIRVRVVGSP